MAIAFRAATGTTAADRSNSAVAVPAAAAIGDVALIHWYCESTTAPTPPAGFTELTFSPEPVTTANGVHRQRVYWKRLTAADTGSYTFAHALLYTELTASLWSGCVASGAPAVSLGSAVEDRAWPNAPAVSGTTTSANTALVHLATQYNFGVNAQPPSGFSLVRDGSSGAVSYKAQAAAGATGSVVATNPGSSTSSWTATLVGLIPALTIADYNERAVIGGVEVPMTVRTN